ncbi:hypothetical protein WAI453_004939 [Rhynchosporium graminicola]
MLKITLFALTTLLLAAVARAADDVIFLYPPDGLTFNYLDTVNVSYISPYKRPILETVCLKYTGGSPLAKDIQFGQPYNASALVLVRWPDFVSCHFIIRPTKARGNGSRDTKSNWFRLDPEARPTPVMFGLNQNETTVANTTDTSSSDKSSSATQNSGLSSGAKIGIGLGVALGVMLILSATAATIFVRRKRKMKAQARAQLLDANYGSAKSAYGAEQESYLVPMNLMPVEIQATGKAQMPHELRSEADIGELSAEQRVLYVPK